MCTWTQGHRPALLNPHVPPWHDLVWAPVAGWTTWPPGNAKCQLTGESEDGNAPRCGADSRGGEGTGDRRGGRSLKKSTAAWRSSSKEWSRSEKSARSASLPCARASGFRSSWETPSSRQAAPPGLSPPAPPHAEKSPSTSMDSSARHVRTAEGLRALPPAGGDTPPSLGSKALGFSLAGFSVGKKYI